MKVHALHIRPGNIVEQDNKPWLVLKTTLLQPGKGGAFVQADLRDIATGTKVNQRWRTQENVTRLHTDERQATFLYAEGDTLTFMDSENYEQHTTARSLAGDGAAFLEGGMEVTVRFIAGSAVAVRLPAQVTVAVKECEPALRRQTASSSYKPALLENGLRVMVPQHINVGDRIVVTTSDMSYAERARS